MGDTERMTDAVEDLTPADILGHALRDARKSAGFTRLRVAVAIGVDPSTVQRWEDGRNMPAFHHVVAVADALGVSVDQFADALRHPKTCPRWDSNPRSSDYEIVALPFAGALECRGRPSRLADVVPFRRSARTR